MTLGKDFHRLPAFTGEDPINIGGAVLQPQGLWVIGTLVVVVAALRWFFEHTRLGKAMLATSYNPLAAQLVGIETRTHPAASASACRRALGALAGILTAPITLTNYDVGIMLGLKGFAAAILGGLGSSYGAVAGGIALGVIEAMSAGYISSAYKDAVAFVIILGGPVLHAERPVRHEAHGAGLGAAARAVRDRRHGSPRAARRRGLAAVGAPRRAAGAGGVLAVLPFFFPNNFYYDVAIKTALNAVVCIGLNLLIGYAGQISLGHAGFFALGAYASAILTTHYKWPGLARACSLARWRWRCSPSWSRGRSCGSRATIWRWRRSASASSSPIVHQPRDPAHRRPGRHERAGAVGRGSGG